MEPQTLSYNNEPTNAQYLYLHSYIALEHSKLIHNFREYVPQMNLYKIWKFVIRDVLCIM